MHGPSSLEYKMEFHPALFQMPLLLTVFCLHTHQQILNLPMHECCTNKQKADAVFQIKETLEHTTCCVIDLQQIIKGNSILQARKCYK